ncbi:motility protein A [Rubrivirga sp.]|uniref:motility protein A n=1 Tax=Rubrivirga sp. TaxID=1885344 RepID=UPI003B51958B
MEKSTPIGLVAGLVLVFGAVIAGDGAATFFDPVSLLIVVGGTFSGLLITFTMDEMKGMVPLLKGFLGFQVPDYGALAAQLADFARTARRDGPLALDARLDEADDPILRSALEMVVDGVDAEQAEAALQTQSAEAAAKPALLTKFFNKAGMYAPAFGMVGTLIGLIQMLQNLNDPAAIGPAMAVAMITTFWGALLANLVFLPMAGKVQGQMMATAKAHQMVRVGALGILAGEAPSALAQRLSLYTGEAPADASEPAPLRRAA